MKKKANASTLAKIWLDINHDLIHECITKIMARALEANSKVVDFLLKK